MKEKTNSILNWGIAIIFAGIICLIVLIPRSVTFLTEPFAEAIRNLGYILAEPSIFLIEYSTRNAINAFGGDMSQEGFTGALIFGLIGVTIVLSLAPTLMAIGYKKAEKSHNKFRHPVWYSGTAIILAALCFGFYSSVSWTLHKKNITEAASYQRTLDHLRLELMDLSFDASTQMILPHEMGGGNGSFTNFLTEGGSFRNITLADLEKVNTAGNFSFVIRDSVTDSTIVITGITNLKGNNPDYQNADGSTGQTQLSMTVNPYEETSRIDFKQENQRLSANRES